jgi:hypothetical protein
MCGSLAAAGLDVRVDGDDGRHAIVLIDYARGRSLCFPVAGDFDAATTALVASWCLRESLARGALLAPITDGPCRACGEWPELTVPGRTDSSPSRHSAHAQASGQMSTVTIRRETKLTLLAAGGHRPAPQGCDLVSPARLPADTVGEDSYAKHRHGDNPRRSPWR